MGAAAIALSPAETRFAPQPEPQTSFSNRVAELLDRLDCRIAETPEEREPIFRLRYECYLREGAISPNASETFSDPYDDSPNARIFGLYLDGELASSIRIHVTSPEHSDFPSYHVFEDLLEPELRAGRVIVDPTRFITDKKLSQLNPGLPYATLAAVLARGRALQRRAFPRRDPRRASGVLQAHVPPSPDLRCAPLPAAGEADQPDDRERRRTSPIRSTSVIRSSARHSSSGACCSNGASGRPRSPCRAPRPCCRSITTGRRSSPSHDCHPGRARAESRDLCCARSAFAIMVQWFPARAAFAACRDDRR